LYEVRVVILVYDRQSIFQSSISVLLRRLLPDSSQIIECASESDLEHRVASNSGAILFAGYLSLQSTKISTARLRASNCSVVWIADPLDKYLPLLTQPAICRVLFRTASRADLMACVAALQEGKSWIQPMDSVDEEVTSRNEKWMLLTPKESRITAFVVKGMENKQIAAQMGTTPQVIKNMLVMIYSKLGAESRYEVFKMFLEEPLTCEMAAVDQRAFKM
jgi:DNA-binding NarL/FixJ family response regulator